MYQHNYQKKYRENNVESLHVNIGIIGHGIANLRGQWMQSSQKMKFEALIHNDEVTCFHMVI